MSGAGEAILDVAGVGYILQCGARTLGAMGVGETVCLHVETHVREQAITLFGFISEEERAWFVRLQSVQGVGPKAALAILDILSPAEILSATSLEDKTAFTRASGVGPKVAGRIVAELAGKPPPAGRGVGSFAAQAAVAADATGGRAGVSSEASLQRDAVSALVNLGIGQSEALRAVASAMSLSEVDTPLDEIVRLALKEL